MNEKPESKESVEQTKELEVTKAVHLVKRNGTRWSVELEGRITQRDINHLQRVLRVEFARARRRRSLERRKQNRVATEVTEIKEKQFQRKELKDV